MCKITGDHVVMGDSTRPLRWRSVLVVLSCWGPPPTQITLPICQSKTTYEITTSQLSTVGGGGQIQVSSMTELILFVLQFQQACTLARMLIWIVLEIVNKWSQSHSKMSDHKLSTRTFSTKASSRHEFFFFFSIGEKFLSKSLDQRKFLDRVGSGFFSTHEKPIFRPSYILSLSAKKMKRKLISGSGGRHTTQRNCSLKW